MSNNQTIKNLRVKNNETSISQVLPIGADAVNVELANRRNLQETIGNIDSRVNGSITNNLEVLSSAIQTLDSIKADTAMIGSPLVAGTASEMTDTSHIYVYTGNESGYTNGNWYYYDGTIWASGGVYNSTAVETDKTLKVENVAADSRATGNMVLVSETQPAAASNKIWIDPDVREIEIPTMGDVPSIEEFNELKDDLNYAKTAPQGYILTASDEGNGTIWSPVGLPTDEQTAQAVTDWLDAHPEATTTVQDGSITPVKFASGAISINSWSGSSSINNWSGATLEEKLCDFLENATNGDKLDLQGQKITITQRFTKTKSTFLNNCIISNGIFEIPASIGGWLSIGSNGGYRVPIFNNCVFVCSDENTSGQIFYDSGYNFKAIGCEFYNIQIINGTYLQTLELVGCNIMNKNSYFIECNLAIGVTMTECSFEAGNVGVFNGKGDAQRTSLTYGVFSNCIFEGFTNKVFDTQGITSAGFIGCYVEDVPYFIYDKNDYVDRCYIYVEGGKYNNRAQETAFLVYSTATYPTLLINNCFYDSNAGQYFCNFENRRKQIATSNYTSTNIFGANSGKNEIVGNNFHFTGTSFSFATNRERMRSQPQAFLVIVSTYGTTVVFTRVSLLTLNYKPSTDGYAVTETPLVTNSQMLDGITWDATASDIDGVVTITGTAASSCSISVINLGATMSGMIL